MTSFLDGKVKLLKGDCLELLPTLAEGSIDSCVTDPPYHLTSIVKRFGKPNSAECQHGTDGAYARASKGFMGKQWDGGDIAFRPEFWAEVLRVLKPGAHLLAFSGTRTYHRMACAIEDAGFEIRDQIGWCYGSGFPKSHDVAKNLDKAGGVDPRKQARILQDKRENLGVSRAELASLIGCTEASIRDWEEGRARVKGGRTEWMVPSPEYRTKLADVLGYTKDERVSVGVSNDRRGDGTVIGLGHTGELKSGGHTNAAKEWQGWGTALKPAWEPIVLARKPLSESSIAANVLKHGTGGINVDGCRIEANGKDVAAAAVPGRDNLRMFIGDGKGRDGTTFDMSKGRWPANLIHDGSEEVVSGFPETGQITPRGNRGDSTEEIYGKYGERSLISHCDSGSAARFFYTAKADKEDRLGSKHPTVKPIDLIQYLCRLVTPRNGTILDPFAGTGTTGEAAFREGFSSFLIEREPEYQADIERRMALVLAGPEERIRESIKASGLVEEAGPLFEGTA
jgi:DNA modification methylase/transcriptional regulator with XRE-family HTH domain